MTGATRLVRLSIKPGGNRIRRRRHLTKRKRSRKDLDEQRFHGCEGLAEGLVRTQEALRKVALG
jgi:hypothetical protein